MVIAVGWIMLAPIAAATHQVMFVLVASAVLKIRPAEINAALPASHARTIKTVRVAKHARLVLPAVMGHVVPMPQITTAMLFAAPPQGIMDWMHIHLTIQNMVVIVHMSANTHLRNE